MGLSKWEAVLAHFVMWPHWVLGALGRMLAKRENGSRNKQSLVSWRSRELLGQRTAGHLKIFEPFIGNPGEIQRQDVLPGSGDYTVYLDPSILSLGSPQT